MLWSQFLRTKRMPKKNSSSSQRIGLRQWHSSAMPLKRWFIETWKPSWNRANCHRQVISTVSLWFWRKPWVQGCERTLACRNANHLTIRRRLHMSQGSDNRTDHKSNQESSIDSHNATLLSRPTRSNDFLLTLYLLERLLKLRQRPVKLEQ